MNNEEKVLEQANFLIKLLNEKFALTKKFDAAANERICGLLEALEIMTGRKFWYDEEGVHEK